MDQLVPPWYWGLSRALYVATTFTKVDETDEDQVMQFEAEFADMIDIKVGHGVVLILSFFSSRLSPPFVLF